MLRSNVEFEFQARMVEDSYAYIDLFQDQLIKYNVTGNLGPVLKQSKNDSDCKKKTVENRFLSFNWFLHKTLLNAFEEYAIFGGCTG